VSGVLSSLFELLVLVLVFMYLYQNAIRAVPRAIRIAPNVSMAGWYCCGVWGAMYVIRVIPPVSSRVAAAIMSPSMFSPIFKICIFFHLC